MDAGMLEKSETRNDWALQLATICRTCPKVKGIITYRFDPATPPGRLQDARNHASSGEIVTVRANRRASRPPLAGVEPEQSGRDARGPPYGATIASGLPRWRLTISLLSAPR